MESIKNSKKGGSPMLVRVKDSAQERWRSIENDPRFYKIMHDVLSVGFYGIALIPVYARHGNQQIGDAQNSTSCLASLIRLRGTSECSYEKTVHHTVWLAGLGNFVIALLGPLPTLMNSAEEIESRKKKIIHFTGGSALIVMGILETKIGHPWIAASTFIPGTWLLLKSVVPQTTLNLAVKTALKNKKKHIVGGVALIAGGVLARMAGQEVAGGFSISSGVCFVIQGVVPEQTLHKVTRTAHAIATWTFNTAKSALCGIKRQLFS